MQFDFNSSVAGVRLLDFRNLLRRSDYQSVRYAAERLGISKAKAARLIKAAAEAGYLAHDPAASKEAGEGLYEVTALGMRLISSKARKRIQRAKADEIISGLPAAIEEINANSEFIYVIKRVLVFGSYLEQTPDLGDIDVVIELDIKPKWEGNIVEANRARARASGRRLSFLEDMFYGQTEVTRAFRKISRYISLHQDHELQALKCETWQIYPPSSSAPAGGSRQS